MDLAKWWNTRGQLGRLGAAATRRGFPRTHYFAQARSVFAVAAYPCHEIFDPPDSVTLWRLPEVIEEEFEAKCEHWLDQAKEWNPFFQRLESLLEKELKIALHAFDVVTNGELEMSSRLRRSAEGRAVPLSEPFSEPIRTSHCSPLHCSPSASRAARLVHSPFPTHVGRDSAADVKASRCADGDNE